MDVLRKEAAEQKGMNQMFEQWLLQYKAQTKKLGEMYEAERKELKKQKAEEDAL